MKNTLILILVLAASPSFAGWIWIDNGDGTQALEETFSDRKWVMRCARFVFESVPIFCDAADVAAGECPSEAQDTVFPVVRDQPCISAKCTQQQIDDGEEWTPVIIRCGDGTFGGADGYDRWPGNGITDPAYAEICKTKWKNRQWWVPRLSDCKNILREHAKDDHNAQILGVRGGERRIIGQGTEVPDETAEQ